MLIYAKFIYLNLCELMNDFLRLRDICGTKFESFAGHLRDIFIVRLKKRGVDTHHERWGKIDCRAIYEVFHF